MFRRIEKSGSLLGLLMFHCLASCLLFWAVYGCGDNVTRLDMDVELGPNYIGIFLTEPDRSCNCTGDSWPKPGECVDVSDMVYCDCDPPPGSCLKSVRLEKEGEVVTWVVPDLIGGVVYISTSGFSPSFEYVLVIEGCGSSARIPLPNEAFPEPVITGFENDEYTLTVNWESDEHAIGSIGLVGTLGGDKCHDVSEGVTRMPCRSSLGIRDRLLLSVFDGGEELRTDLGAVRIWRGAYSDMEIYFPQKKDSGLWSLPNMSRPVIRITIGGTESEGTLTLLSACVDVGGSEPLVDLEGLASTHGGEFSSIGLRYTAGTDTDRLQLQTQDVFVGEFPHVTPVDGLDLGKPENDSFVLDVGPVTLQKEDDPSTTIEVSLSLTWDLEVPVSKPVNR